MAKTLQKSFKNAACKDFYGKNNNTKIIYLEIVSFSIFYNYWRMQNFCLWDEKIIIFFKLHKPFQNQTASSVIIAQSSSRFGSRNSWFSPKQPEFIPQYGNSSMSFSQHSLCCHPNIFIEKTRHRPYTHTGQSIYLTSLWGLR